MVVKILLMTDVLLVLLMMMVIVCAKYCRVYNNNLIIILLSVAVWISPGVFICKLKCTLQDISHLTCIYVCILFNAVFKVLQKYNTVGFLYHGPVS